MFERYYPLLFGYSNNDLINFYDDGILSKHLLVFDDIYYLETSDGFIMKNYEEMEELINNNIIDIIHKDGLKRLIKT